MPEFAGPSSKGGTLSDTVGVAGDRIRSFVERIEQLDTELQELNEGKKEVFAEAKGEGFDVKMLKEIIKLRKQAKVVKVYTLFAELLPAEAREGRAPVQVFVAAHDEAAKKAVFDVVAKSGFEPVDSGPLSNARFLEPVGEMNIHFAFFLDWGTSAAPLGPASPNARPSRLFEGCI
jgi:uncharacterized protein (UPF0335 family)